MDLRPVVAIGNCPIYASWWQVPSLENLGGTSASVWVLGPCGVALEDALEYLRGTTTRPIVIYDPVADVRTAGRYMRAGADDIVTDPESLLEAVETALSQTAPDDELTFGLVGASPSMERAKEIVRLAGPRRATVLVTGETGTGKELFARAIHAASPRAALPMITVNAAALPENLLEAELFGHVKGAFTGAFQARIGRFEQAHRSTLFLDEIGDLPMPVQTKLLRFLQERELQRIGSSENIRVDVRLIAATNVELAARVREGKFREDLYYRLNVVPLVAPPLRSRGADIAMLAQHFVVKICVAEDLPQKRFSSELLGRLQAYSWPGNVRQLENAVEMAVTMSGDRDLLVPADFASVVNADRPVLVPDHSDFDVPSTGLDFEGTVGAMERRILEDALRKSGGNKTAAAEMLGLKRTTLSAKLRSLAVGAS